MKKPFILQTILAVAACKFTRWLCRLTKSGGTALPGKVAMALEKNVLEVTSHGMEIIVVTGTNGKTTTCRMIEHALTENGHETLANKSGANLLSGVTAEITCNADWLGRPKTHYAVIECDEAALKQVVPLIHPKVIAVTNLFRDQLDRYGEVMHTVDTIRVGIRKVPDAILCLNADDSLVSSLAFDVPNKVVYYGINCAVGDGKAPEISDAKYCIRCGSEYDYNYRTYAHLGDFCCPDCGYRRQKPHLSIEEILEIGAKGSRVKIAAPGRVREITVGLPAVYNIYNAAAACAAYTEFGLPAEEIESSLGNVHSSFGRMENFELDGRQIQMILVKNPAGCNQALSYLSSMNEEYNAVFCLNDRTADGHDISWIWDADFEKVTGHDKVRRIFVSGDRAEDMQLRLKYADAPEDKITLVRDNETLLAELRKSEYPVFILPNYTSMLALRKVLSDATGGNDFWKG